MCLHLQWFADEMKFDQGINTRFDLYSVVAWIQFNTRFVCACEYECWCVCRSKRIEIKWLWPLEMTKLIAANENNLSFSSIGKSQPKPFRTHSLDVCVSFGFHIHVRSLVTNGCNFNGMIEPNRMSNSWIIQHISSARRMQIIEAIVRSESHQLSLSFYWKSFILRFKWSCLRHSKWTLIAFDELKRIYDYQYVSKANSHLL